MSVSLPSKPTSVVEIPKLEIVSSKFIYNFFTPDEMVNEKGTFITGHGTKNQIDENLAAYEGIAVKVPRYVKIDFSYNKKYESDSQQTYFASLLENSIPIPPNIISNNLNKIIFEGNFSNFEFSSIEFQDSGIDQKLFHLMSGSLALKLDTILTPPKPVEEPIFDKEEMSILEAAKLLNSLTSEDVDKHLITDSLSNINNKETIFKSIKDLNFHVQINNSSISSILKNVINDPLSIYSDELSILNKKFDEIISKKKFLKNIDNINELEYESIIDFVLLRTNTGNIPFKHYRTLVGYIANKFEILPNGEIVHKQPIILENPNSTTLLDPHIKYGSTYVYTIRAIILTSFDASALILDPKEENENKIFTILSLISSKPSNKITITCTEEIFPTPPADFVINWDYNRSAPRLMWNFPVNKQRDIKYFQIFKRNSISFPFELIKQYDFDDSLIKIQPNEFPNPLTIEKLTSPKTYFIDENFDKNSTVIYALCAVDAHGMSSGYSQQFSVTFDKYKKNIRKNLISRSGAPKMYPNLFLNEDIFIDVMKTSGYEKIKIYFEPEYLKIFTTIKNENQSETSQNNLIEIPLLVTDKTNGTYILQMINVDLQEQKRISIKLEDLRDF